MKILLITAPNYDDSEVLYPYYRLLEAGFAVDVASWERGPVPGKYHFVIEANKTLAETDPAEYAGLLLPGGTAPEKLRQSEEALRLVRYFAEHRLPVASICHGQQLLISAGVLRGMRATCYPGIRDDLKNAGASYVNEPAVTDGWLVTSRRPEDLPWFMRAYLECVLKPADAPQNDENCV